MCPLASIAVSALVPGSRSLEFACSMGEPFEDLAALQVHLLERRAPRPLPRRAPAGAGSAHGLPPEPAGAAGRRQGALTLPLSPSRCWARWPRWLRE
eukprot:9250702-Pyramimonas_sp.AAC.1